MTDGQPDPTLESGQLSFSGSKQSPTILAEREHGEAEESGPDISEEQKEERNEEEEEEGKNQKEKICPGS